LEQDYRSDGDKQNRGIGLAICESILKTNQNVKLYAASRAGADLGLKSAGSGSIKYPKLDVTKDQDIKQLAEDIKREEGQISVLINNAGCQLSRNLRHVQGLHSFAFEDWTYRQHVIHGFAVEDLQQA
jgi:NAD(P)-dependent dehydrogenase (short-subunit alcohol dehydrogenase family)